MDFPLGDFKTTSASVALGGAFKVMASQLKKVWVLLVVISLTTFHYSYSQESCCNDEICREKAERLALELAYSTKPLGPDPNSFELRETVLDTFRVKHRSLYSRLIKDVKRIEQFSQDNIHGSSCINSFIDSEDVLDWSTHLLLKLNRTEGLSPEFCKGFELYFGVNTGVADLFKESESFSSSVRALISYTFSRNQCGGRVRVMLGPSLYYQNREAIFLATPRAEFRLKDIGTDLVSIGTTKLITQINFNDSILIGGLGLGLELDRFGAQILGEFQSGGQNYSIQTGFFYQFKL